MNSNSRSGKLDCYLNDDTGVIVLCLWDSAIDIVKTNGSGCYELNNVAVWQIESLGSELILGTTSKTLINPLRNYCKQSTPTFQLFETRYFPIRNFKILSKTPRCNECGHVAAESAEKPNDFFKCVKCKSATNFSRLSIMLLIRITFGDDEEVTVFSK